MQARCAVIHRFRRWIMGKPYSVDLRERIAAPVAAGGSRRGAGRQFAVSPSTAVRVLANQAERGTLEPRKQGRPSGQGKLAPYVAFLVEIVGSVPDITLPELAAALLAEHGVKVHPSSLSRVLIKSDMTYKKDAPRLGARAGGRPGGAPRVDRRAAAAHAPGAAPADLHRRMWHQDQHDAGARARPEG
jgi:transposase